MSYTTIRPANSTTYFGTTMQASGGAGTVHGVLSDSSESSFAYSESGDNEGNTITWADTGSLPAGAVPKSWRIRLRSKGRVSTGARQFVYFKGVYVGQTITWMTLTTTDVAAGTMTAWPDETVDFAVLQLICINPAGTATFGGEIFEAYLDLYYVNKPTVDVTGPAVTTTNIPTTTWTRALDSDGGVATQYQVKIFNSAAYASLSTDAQITAASTYTDTSGIVDGDALTWTGTVGLPNTTYRCYVRVAQTVNGEQHWSSWDYSQFTQSIDLPAVPTLSVADDASLGRIGISVSSNSGTATTSLIQIEASDDGGTTWRQIRTSYGDGSLDSFASSPDVYDYEARNGVLTYYRARAGHIYTSTFTAWSAWTSSASDTWTATGTYWLKHPFYPDTLSVAVTLMSPASGGVGREARESIYQPLGSSVAVAVSDVRGPRTGALKIRCDTAAARTSLYGLLDASSPVLFQRPYADSEDDIWISLGNSTSTKAVDSAGYPITFEDVDWVEVERPGGALP